MISKVSMSPLLTIPYLIIISCPMAAVQTAMAAGPQESSADKLDEPGIFYEVKNGDTLGDIALSHGFALVDIMEANGIDNADTIFAGQKLHFPIDPKHGRLTKKGVLLKVPEGFNLTRIAAAYEIRAQELVTANRITNPNHIRVGQELLIPGAKFVVKLVPPPPCYKDPVSLYRVRNDDSRSVSLCFCDGTTNPEGVEVLSDISGPIGEENDKLLRPRLVALVQKIAENFPGHRIEIISGYRSKKQKGVESNHNKGRALDFRVAGISNKKLTTFLRSLGNVGVGYYPNSVFVHLDIREIPGYWVDYSRPGERAIYGRSSMTKTEIEEIRNRRAQKIADHIEAENRENSSDAVNTDSDIRPATESNSQERRS